MELKGKYENAIIYNEEVESSALNQIKTLINCSVSKNSNIRIMPDVHAGAGCVIGYTAKLTDKIIPNLIGVDIGCGVTAWDLDLKEIDFKSLDDYIRKNIPSGRNSNNSVDFNELGMADSFYDDLREVSIRLDLDLTKIIKSIGSLGGGNHFIEVDKKDDGDLMLVIHSGSRNFGLQVATYHQKIAEKSKDFNDDISKLKRLYSGVELGDKIRELRGSEEKIPKELSFLEGEEMNQYLKDMGVAQVYAQLSRKIMGNKILNHLGLKIIDPIESVHNYIDQEFGIIRKGAISARLGEDVVVPLNMKDGTIIGKGKGNVEWNNSSAHGSGRNFSRTKAKEVLSLKEFEDGMKDVWSSCISKDTLDESPMAYKNSDDIISYLKETVDIECHMKPVYNFKA